MKTAIVGWVMSLLMWKASPERLVAQYQLPGYEETVEQKTARYQTIAEDAVSVAFDPTEQPLYGGIHGRAKTAATLLAVAFHEGGFAKDVDTGPCYRGKDGKGSRCDGGRSSCLLQIHIGAGSTIEGWSQADLFSDRKKCFRAGLHLMKRSFRACGKLGLDHAFDSYAGGTCGLLIGHKRGVELATLSTMFYKYAAPPGSDSEFLIETNAPEVSYLEPRPLAFIRYLAP